MLALPVWGDWYTEALIDAAMPSILAPGNLPALAARARTRYRLYASPVARRRIEASAPFSELARIAPVDVIEVEPPERGSHKYNLAADCHRDTVDVAEREDAAIIPLYPDIVFSDGAFAQIHERATEGRRGVMVVPFRVSDSAIPVLRKRTDGPSRALSLTPREAMSIAINHVHPYTRRHYWSSPHFTRWPDTIMWDAGDEGLIVYSYHMTPVMLWPRTRGVRPPDMIDNISYVPAAVPDPRDFHVVRDSDELVMWGLHPLGSDRDAPVFQPEDTDAPISRHASTFRIAVWAVGRLPQHCHHLASAPIALRTRDPSTAWARAERQARTVMRRVSFLIKVRCFGGELWHEDRSVPRAKFAIWRSRRFGRAPASTG